MRFKYLKSTLKETAQEVYGKEDVSDIQMDAIYSHLMSWCEKSMKKTMMIRLMWIQGLLVRNRSSSILFLTYAQTEYIVQ
jgi:hypothetical protein